MSQIDDLLNSACEVRDADQDRENTAMRVGGLLVSIIEYVGGFVTSTELERILNDAGEEFDRMYAKIDSRGMLDYRHSWFVPLSSMGSALDNVDGGVFDYAAEEGDLFYLKRGNYQIHEQQSTGSIGYPAKPRVVYYNLHTGRMYRWDGNDMVELGDLNRYRDRHVIDIMNLTDLNVMQIGEIAFKQSTGELVIRTGARQWFTFTADPNAIYCDKSGKRILIWNGTGWDEVGGGSGSEGGATSVVVKRNVNALQAKVDELIGLLANSAFSTSRPAPIGTLDWGDDTPVETYYNVNGISASHAMYSVTNAATRVLADSSYNNVITAKAGYDLLGVTVNGVAQTVNNDSCTINIANVQGDITIVVSAQAESVTPTITHTVQATLTDLNLQPYGGTVNDGGTFTATLALGNGVSGKRLPTLSEITINGSHGTASLTNGTLTIPNITSDISIIAAAVATSGVTHSVTYNLSGVNKTSGATEVEDGQQLTVVLSKDSSFNGYYTSKAVHFGARDVIVYMNGQVVSGVVSQNGLDNDVTIAIPQVTGDVVIMNEVWLAGYVDYEGNVHSSTRSVYSSVLIPIPSGCTELTIKHLYQNSSNWGGAFYNGNSYVSGVKFDKADNGQNVTIPGNVTHIKLSVYDFNQSYTIADTFIKDATHNVYIWKGDNVQ